MKLILLLALTALAACGAADAPSVGGAVYMGTFWQG